MWSRAWLASAGMGDGAGGGLGEGCTADNDFDLPAEMSIHLTCLEKIAEYINLICRGELVR